MNKTLLVLGAKSDIGLAVAYRFAQEGYDIQLAARGVSELDSNASDITIRYNVNVSQHEFDVLNYDLYNSFVESLPVLPAVVLSSIGLMGEQSVSETNAHEASLVMRTNFEAPANILGFFANLFEKRGYGSLIGISSVAGERGKRSNYIYGSAKSGFTNYLSGLRNRLQHLNINVLTVKPGFIYTKMTSAMHLPKSISSTPSKLADAIYKGMKKSNLYFPFPWHIIMLIIKLMPEFIFKKTNM